MKKGPIIQIVCFCVFIGVFAILNFAIPSKDFSSQENRYLSQAPKFSLDSLFSGDFTSDFEKYITDQFTGRDGWITLKAASERALLKTENNNVLFGSQGLLAERYSKPSASLLETNISAVNSLCQNTDVPVYLALIPGAVDVWSDRLPLNSTATGGDQSADISSVYNVADAVCIDIEGVLREHASEYIYYNTDHHWTSLGACYASEAILEAMGVTAKKPSEFTPDTVSYSFYGTAWSSSGATWTAPDSIQTFVPEPEGLSIENYSSGTPQAGVLYDYSKLEVKDKYSFFLGGNTPLLKFSTGSQGPKLLVIRDSYFDSELPFLLEHFSEIHVLDLRYYRLSVADYVRDNDIDSVLVAYSMTNFSTDTGIFLAGR